MKKFPDLTPQQFVDDLQKEVRGLKQICFVGMITEAGSYIFKLAPNQKSKDLKQLRSILSDMIKDVQEEERLCRSNQSPK